MSSSPPAAGGGERTVGSTLTVGMFSFPQCCWRR